MKITLFTANNQRHNYFINLLSSISDELFVIQECSTTFQGIVPGHYPATQIMKEYFEYVSKAQQNIFGNAYIEVKSKLSLKPILLGDLNRLDINTISEFLKSDLYIIFGSSYIKGDLVEFLSKKKAINIHMGISPFYRGCDCNFWALYDGNPHLAGATIHMLSKGLDSGPILYHALSNIKTDPYTYTMSCVKSAFHSIAERIKNKEIFNIKSEIQEKSKEIRYSKKEDFNERVASEFLNKNMNPDFNFTDLSIYKDAFILEEL